MNFIRNLFFPSVDSLVSALTTTTARLQKHAARQANKAGVLRDEAAYLTAKAGKAELESARADRTAQRIAKLVA